MTGSPTWVIGAGGLLGRHVVAALRRHGRPVLTQHVPWREPDRAAIALRAGIDALLDAAGGGPWNIAWCAGTGVMATPEVVLRSERAQFTEFLAALEARTAGTAPAGAFFLASSAGGAYAGSPDLPPYDETSRPRPLAAYGHVKLAMEGDLAGFAASTSTPALIGRIANLYGPGQNLAKQQGLISQMCRAVLTGDPLTIYVSLDTLRDYIFAADCAEIVAVGLDGLRERTGGRVPPVLTKVMASGRSTTIASLLSEGHRVLKRRPRAIVKAPSPVASVQARDLRLHSVVWPELNACAQTPLAVGIARTAQDVGAQLRAAKGRGQ